MQFQFAVRLGFGFFLALAASCGGKSPANPAAQPPAPADGGSTTSTVTMMIPPTGGTIALGNASLTVPSGAIAAPAAITMVATQEAAPAGFEAGVKVFRFEPAGLAFAVPVTVKLPAPANAEGAAIYWSTETEHFERLPTTVVDGLAVAEIQHFSTGFVARSAATYTSCTGTCQPGDQWVGWQRGRYGCAGTGKSARLCARVDGAAQYDTCERDCLAGYDSLGPAPDGMICEATRVRTRCAKPGVPDAGAPPDAAVTAPDAPVADAAAKDAVAETGSGVPAMDAAPAICTMAPDGVPCAGGFCCGGACTNARSVLTCGPTCQTCPIPDNAAPTCDGTMCGFVCNTGFTKCGDSCVDLQNDSNNCSECGKVCSSFGADFTCQAGQCESSICPIGQRDCDEQASNGCEVNITNDVRHCGECGRVCEVEHGTPACVSRSCKIGVCETGYDDCDRNYATGCERYLPTDPNHCGACGKTCVGPCSNGSCVSVVQLVTGHNHNCVLLSDGTVRCWGDNRNGQLGNGEFGNDRSVPRPVMGLSGVVQLAAGHYSTCAVVTGGKVRCWGRNLFGALGDGTEEDRNVPVDVVGLDGITQVSMGNVHGCARRFDGMLWCWGFNLNGQLGDQQDTHYSVTPVQARITDVDRVIAGVDSTCILDNGDLICWGDNTAGQLGNGKT
ncbi:MAG TPA: hypothetical protein VGF45_10975, partial [Polyangia bacterium]